MYYNNYVYIFSRSTVRDTTRFSKKPERNYITMKERFNIEIADIQFSIVSDEGEEFVRQTVETVDKRVKDLIINNKRCSKLDAVILCALDYCGERQKAEKKIRSLEAQVELLETNMRRLREEAEQSKGTQVSAHEADAHETDAHTAASENIAAPEAPAAAETAPDDDSAKQSSTKSENDAVQSKLRMIEELLGGKKN